MNYRWITAGVIAVLALVAGCLSYSCIHPSMPRVAGTEGDALVWVRQEFNLSGERLARIEAMHAAYEKVCVEHCRAIAESQRELRRAMAAGASPAAMAAATAQVQTVDARCVADTKEHIERIAAVIGGEDGRRYLSVVLPRVQTYGHTITATLDMSRTSTHEHSAGD